MGIFEAILLIIICILARMVLRSDTPRKKKKGDRLGRRPPYIDLGLDVEGGYMEVPCEQNIEYLSRHSIAEQDVKCPRCALVVKDTKVVDQGDYSTVKWTWTDNGVRRYKNECIHCPECSNWLLASPDTEHNDHKNYEEDPPEFFFFVRKSEVEVVREKYGADALEVDNRGIYVKDGGDPDAVFTEAAVPKNSIDDQPLPTEPSPAIRRGAHS